MSMPKLNDFELLEVIGTGSYSVVHRARQKDSNQTFAIKCVTKANLSRSSTENLLQEIGLLKTLKHKHIVEMNDFRWDEKSIYIVMELCNAGNLSAYIKKHKTLSENVCRYFMQQLASAMQYMRTNNISHFDLKPQNLLLCRSNGVMLTLKMADFGFAQYLNSNEENTVIKGSPLYMAPEILLKHSYNPSADLWSIGVILYECIFGSAPYRSKSMDELLDKIRSRQKIVIAAGAKISHDCRDMMMRLLVHEPDKRLPFREFFEHKFLDLKHAATDENLQNAIRIVKRAVEEDQRENYRDAYYLYCDGLQYFIPLIAAETDAEKRLHLQERATTYMERAEEIKKTFKQAFIQQQYARSASTEGQSCSKECESNQRSTTVTSFKHLLSLFAATPTIQGALEIGRKGELYTYEQNFSAALECFTSALNVLVPMLPQEPAGKRKEVLQKQVLDWMKEAESIKTLLMAHNMTSDKNERQQQQQQQHCCVQ